MDFLPSIEQVALAAAERGWLVKNDPITERRPNIDAGPARAGSDGIRHLAESGLIGLLCSRSGGSHVDLAVLVEEHGRAASPLALAELAIAALILERIEHPSLGATESGDALVVPLVGSVEASGPSAALTARTDGTGLLLTGTTAPATGLLDANSVLLIAATDTGTEVAAVVPVGDVTVRTLETLDLTRSWAVADVALTLDSGRWTELEPGTVEYVHDALATFRSIDALGGASRLVEMTVEYARQRTQFGHPIGSFQAVKHHCADMTLAVEAARAALWAAAVALDGTDRDVRRRAVSAAAAFAGDSTGTTAQTALQIHGGIGFTWEHDVHLFIRRIKIDELLDGSVSYHRRRLAAA